MAIADLASIFAAPTAGNASYGYTGLRWPAAEPDRADRRDRSGDGRRGGMRMRPTWRETLHDLFTAASILIALAAAAFTWIQLRYARNAVLVQLRPHVDFDIEESIVRRSRSLCR